MISKNTLLQEKAQTCLERNVFEILIPFASYHHYTKKKNNRACGFAMYFSGEYHVFPSLNH